MKEDFAEGLKRMDKKYFLNIRETQTSRGVKVFILFFKLIN